MEFLQETFNHFGTFFSLDSLKQVLFDPANWGIIGTLIILEGLLSADNALVLAMMVKHLPEEQRRKALFYGIIGAYFFRFLIIGLGLSIIHIGWIKIVCGHYLLFLVLQNLFQKNDDDDDVATKKMGFWKTVLTVELVDITFSFDSVLAAFGVSNQEWVLLLGGILGILMMRGVARLFLALIDRVPELETTAFVLIGVIGLKMIGTAFGFHMEDILFFSVLITIFFGTFIIHWFRKTLGNKTVG
ncbi:DUF475 domain-containing protein [Robertmurraya yapensis]|uniref:DUF475 domain-containing protein n=1 Tax=Bacillus yapensis TaxID=2492960 RepID=A0A431WI01_9BACI|nr:DUF475 domain-containing protein [Bacillus yapensis]RTR35182.1 DUF475 domain-containing protein [Bacillus yapensis]TKS97691.1 DUF475 domain-containing protein [Bacillus yapensis]